MIQKILCWLLGHKTMFRVATGQTLTADGAFERDVKYVLLSGKGRSTASAAGERFTKIKRITLHAQEATDAE